MNLNPNIKKTAIAAITDKNFHEPQDRIPCPKNVNRYALRDLHGIEETLLRKE